MVSPFLTLFYGKRMALTYFYFSVISPNSKIQNMAWFNPIQEETDPDRPGNIWGRKFSLISLGIILFFSALVYVRWVQLGKPSMKGIPATEESVQPDSTKTDSIKG